MTNKEKDALREAASKATPGPWEIGNTSDDIRMVLSQSSYVCSVKVYQFPRGPGMWQEPQRIANAHYIALAHPAAVLELLDECERMREALQEALTVADNLPGLVLAVSRVPLGDQLQRANGALQDAYTRLREIRAALGDGA